MKNSSETILNSSGKSFKIASTYHKLLHTLVIWIFIGRAKTRIFNSRSICEFKKFKKSWLGNLEVEYFSR